MLTWAEFEAQTPELAAAGRRLLYQFETGLGFLGTVRRDGGPRMHPVCPILAGDGLYVFVLSQSPKYHDLLRDPRYAMHSFPTEPPEEGGDGDEEFYITGEARCLNDDSELRQQVVDVTGGKLGIHDFESLFEFRLQNALHTTWHNWSLPDTWPEYRKWKAS